MEKLKKYRNTIIISILLIAGAIAVVFGKSLAVQGGIAGIAWGCALLIFAIMIKKRNDKELEQYDVEMTEILKDIASKEEDSEYYGLVDISRANKDRAKIVKKQRKQVVSCAIIGVLLIVLAIVCIV